MKYLLNHSIHFHSAPYVIGPDGTYIDTSEQWLFRDCLVTCNTRYSSFTDVISSFELLVQPDCYTWRTCLLNLNQHAYFLRRMSRVTCQQDLTHLLNEFPLT